MKYEDTGKSIFRDINEGEDVSDIVKKLIVVIVVGAAVIILLIAGWALYRSVPKATAIEVYGQELTQREADPAWRKEQRRLRKKHGADQVPIYEPGRTPYYKCNNGQKCRYI
jgi:hypothetical protein